MGTDQNEKSGSTDLKRIADALERLAAAQENAAAKPNPQERIADQLESISASLEKRYNLEYISTWYAQFRQLDEAVSPAALETMRTMLDEFVTPEYSAQILRSGGVDTLDHRLKRLLMKHRLYEYLLITSNLQRIGSDLFPDAEGAVERWLMELAYDPDFRMVHVRKGVYYERFAQKVNASFAAAAEAAKKQGIPITGEMIARAIDVSEARARPTGENKVDVEFEIYTGSVVGDSQREKYDRIATINFLPVPMNRESFQHFWLHLPEWESNLEEKKPVSEDAGKKPN